MSTEKTFLIKDLSGRGFTATFTEQELRAAWETELAEDEELAEFIEDAEAGEEHTADTTKIICLTN